MTLITKQMILHCNEFEDSSISSIGFNDVIVSNDGYYFMCPLCHKHHKITNPEYIKELNKYYNKHFDEENVNVLNTLNNIYLIITMIWIIVMVIILIGGII